MYEELREEVARAIYDYEHTDPWRLDFTDGQAKPLRLEALDRADRALAAIGIHPGD